MGDVVRLAVASAVYNVLVIHRLYAVDDGDGRLSHVRCRRCGQEYPNVMIAARVPCRELVVGDDYLKRRSFCGSTMVPTQTETSNQTRSPPRRRRTRIVQERREDALSRVEVRRRAWPA